ncbi:hypothetical protein ACHAXM_007953 [Skeletonema potamos]
MWNIDDIYGDDLPPYHPGMNSSSEDGSSSSTSRGSDDSSDDSSDDDNDNDGRGVAKAKKKRKDTEGADSETTATTTTAAASATTTTAAAAAAATTTTAAAATIAAAAAIPALSIEVVATEFAKKGFQLDGTVLNAKAKMTKVASFVKRILRDDPDLVKQDEPHLLHSYFESWVDVAWTEVFTNLWFVLRDMLNKKKDGFRSNVNVSGTFSECACKLGRMFHTQQCKKDNCDLCDDSLPDRAVSFELTISQRMYVKELVDCYEKAAADARRTESDAMAKKGRQQKKANKKLQGGKVSNFGYAPSRLAKEKCPCCGHGYLQKLLTDAQLKNANKQRKKKHSKRMSAYEKKHASKKNEQNKPRLRLQSMEFKCPCLWLKGSKCPECNGLNIDSCEICICTCQTGPIEWKDFESVSRGAQSRARGLEENTIVIHEFIIKA